MPQDDPLIAAVRRARQARAGAPQADPLLQEIQRVRAASTTPPGAVIPNDTTVGPNGIRADDPDAVQRYLDSLNEDGARRDSVARATPAAPLTHEQRAAAVRPRYVPGYGGMRMPWNEAARDEAAAQEYKGEAGERQLRLDVMSPRTRALGYALAGGRTILGIPGFARTVLEAAGRPFVGRHTQRALADREASERAAGLPVTPEPGVQLARMPLDIAEMMGRAGQRDPEALGEVASLLATGPKPKLRGRGAVAPVAARAPGRPAVPYELDVTPPPASPATAPKPRTRGQIRAELDAVIARQRTELSPGPADLDAMIQRQQAELAQGVAGPAERPGKTPSPNPLTETADHIEQLQAEIKRLQAEHEAMVAERERAERTPEQRAPDALRDLPDEALGETPPPEQSAAATQEARIPEIAKRILQAERRRAHKELPGSPVFSQPRTGPAVQTSTGQVFVGPDHGTAINRALDAGFTEEQIAFDGHKLKDGTFRPRNNFSEMGVEAFRNLQEMERRAAEGPPDPTPATADPFRAELERQGFMGTGPESMTPEDVAGTRILGGEVVGDISTPIARAHSEGRAPLDIFLEPGMEGWRARVQSLIDKSFREPLTSEELAELSSIYRKAESGELRSEKSSVVGEIREAPIPGSLADVQRQVDAYMRQKVEPDEVLSKPGEIVGEIRPAADQPLFNLASGKAVTERQFLDFISDYMDAGHSPEAVTSKLIEIAQAQGIHPDRMLRMLSRGIAEANLPEAQTVKLERVLDRMEFGSKEPVPPGASELDAYYRSPEVQARIAAERDRLLEEAEQRLATERPFGGRPRGPELVRDAQQLGPERLPGESVLDYSRRIRQQRDPSDVRVPGTTGGKQPPLPPKKPPTAGAAGEEPGGPIDMTGIDVQIEALRAEQARLREASERSKIEHPGEHPSFARKARLREKGGAGAEAAAARKRTPSRRDLEAEARSVRATLRNAEKTLQRFPESDKREIAVRRRNEAMQLKLAAQDRLAEIDNLKKTSPLKRPPLKGPKGTMGPGMGPETGAMRMFPEGRGLFRRRKPLSDAEMERLGLLSSEVEGIIRRGGRYDDISPELGAKLRDLEKKFDAGWPLNYEDLRLIQEYRDAMHMPPLDNWEKARYMMRREPNLPGPDIFSEEGFALNPFAKKRAPAPLSAAERAVDKQIGRGVLAERTPFRVRWHQLIQNLTETSHFVGKLQRIAEKHGRQLPLTQKARYWMKAALDSPKRIAGALYEGGPGYFDDAGKWTPLDSPSLEAIIKPIAGDVAALQRVERLLLAEHNPAMLAAKRQTNISPAAAAEVVRTATPRTKLVAAKMRAWLNATVEGAVRAGALPRGLLDAWQKQYPHYIPAERVFEGEGAVSGGGGSTRGGVRPPARRAKKGGPQPYASPFETIPDYGARWIRYTDLYRASRSTLDLVTQNRDIFGDLAVKVSEKPLAQVNAVEAIGELLSDKALRLEGDQIRVYDPASNSMQVWKLEPILADGLRALTSREWDFVTEFLGAGKRGVQFGVTNNPFFGLANWLRDNTGRPILSGATHYPMAKTFGSSPEFRTMGGGFGIAEESAGFAESLRRSLPGRSSLRSAQRTRQGRAAKLTGTVSTPVRTVRGLAEALKSMSVPFEEATRGAEFRAQRAKGLSDLEAYVNAQEALGNFAEHGTAAWVRWLNHVTPFLNPRIQGLRAFYEAGTRRPGSTALKAALTITIPSLALYALQQDDQEIEDLRNGPGGYNSWYIRPSNILPGAPDDVILRMPKPFMPGALAGTSVEHALDALRDRDPHAFKRMLSDISSELWQSSINPVLGVPQALATNKAIGTGVPIVPSEQKDFLPEEQVGTHPNYTLQELSRMLPRRARFSPARAQYALGQFGGTMGREIPNFLDRQFQADRIPEPRGLTDFPGVSRFFARTPTSAAAPIRDVYDDSRRGIQIMETLQGLAANGDVTGALRLLEEHGDELADAGAGQAYTQKLSQISDAAEFFANSEHLTPRERREYRDEMLRLLTELARTFHGAQHDRAPQ